MHRISGDMVGGQISFIFASPLEVMPNVKAGRLNVIAVTSAKRVSYWLDVPTLVESGCRAFALVLRSEGGKHKDRMTCIYPALSGSSASEVRSG